MRLGKRLGTLLRHTQHSTLGFGTAGGWGCRGAEDKAVVVWLRSFG
jgi:hypothetical protein